MSTAKPASRIKRTLPNLPPQSNVKKCNSPRSSPLSSRKKLTPSPAAFAKPKSSKLPVPSSRRNVASSSSKNGESTESLRKIAAANLFAGNGISDPSKNGLKSAKNADSNGNDSGSRNTSKNSESFDSLNMSGSDTRTRALSESFSSNIKPLNSIRKSESMTSLDSLCGVNTSEEERSCVTVAVRVRPFNQRETKNNNVHVCLSVEGNAILTSGPGLKHNFTYDQCFWSFDENCDHFASQETVYEKIGTPLLENAFEGYNTCLFAYGQTGSGKSYSMMGLNHDEKAGIIPRFCGDLFEKINTRPELIFTVEISYFEIYNEKIHDLLDNRKAKDQKKAQLRVREHPELGTYIQDLSTYIVASYSDIESWLTVGNKSRATAATGMNEKSSRSHSVFTIILTQTQTQLLEGTETQMCKTSKINLIDLAGSERASSALNDDVIDSKETYDLRLKEGGSINKSLHTLGKVISVLSVQEKAGKKKKVHIPYRDSVLTWLLKDSLGGNSKTAMIATVSPSIAHYEETMSTLRYASQARCIVNRARVNEDPNAKLIRELMAEIERLKESSISSEPEINNSLNDEITSLREKLKETTALLAESTKNWQEKLELSEKRKLEEAEKFKKAGISFKVDNKLPNLVNLNEDPQLSEMLLYILKEGETTVGRLQSEICKDHDIQLNGVLVAENHCYIRNEGEKVYITPQDEAPTYVNGQLLSEETTLHHGDRLVIGGDHYFRFNHPIEREQRRQGSNEKERSDNCVPGETVMPKDFEFARNELAQVQKARLQAELEEARIKAKEEIMNEIQIAKETAQQELNEQKQGYEKRLTDLQSSLKEVGAEKTEIEKSHQSAEDKISKLQAHKLLLEQEILNNRKRLQMEALAAKQALEETKVNQVRIISELEKEKKKIKEDVEKLKVAKKMREQRKISTGSIKNDKDTSELLRISVMLREANKISESLGKRLTFSRDDILLNDKVEVKIRLNNTKLGITTVWPLEKFESKLMQMREMYQQSESDNISGDEDPFNDPNDEWEKDFTLDSPSENARMSRRDSLNLVTNLKNSLASPLSSMGSPSVLYGVSPRARVLMNNAVKQEKAENMFVKYRTQNQANKSAMPIITESAQSSPPETFSLDQTLRGITSVPAICREMVSLAISNIESTSSTMEEPSHERIMKTINEICVSIATLRKEYKNESAERHGVPLRETQLVRYHTINIMTNLDRLYERVKSWCVLLDGNETEKVRDMTSRILDSVRRIATHLTKILMGCDGDMVPLIEESADKVEYNLSILAKQVAKLAVTSCCNYEEDSLAEEIEVQIPCAAAFVEGQNLVLRDTIQDCLRIVKESLQNIQKYDKESNEVEKEIKDDSSILLKSVVNFIRNEDDIQKSLTTLKDVTCQTIFGKRVYHCQQVVISTRSITKATETLTSAFGKTKIADAALLSNMAEVSNEMRTSVNTILENTQCLIELDSINFPEKTTSTTTGLFASKDKLKIKGKNVRLTSRELTQTLKKYSFLCDERSTDKNHAGNVYGTPLSRAMRGLRDRTNAQNMSQKKLVTEFNSPFSPNTVVLTTKESPI